MAGIDLQLLYVFQSFFAAAVAAALAVFLAPRWNALSARSLLLLMASVAIWSFTYGMEFKSDGLAAKLFWMRTEYLGAAWTGVFFFQFCMTLTGRSSWLRSTKWWALFIIPVLTILAVATNESHRLIWSQAWIETSGTVTAMAYQRGIGFWIFVAYSYGLLATGTVLLLHGYLFARRVKKKHFWVVLTGVLAPWVSNAVYLVEFDPLRHVDFTPAAFTVSGLAFFWGTVRHQMLELIPIARDAVVESMQDAVIVLDRHNRIIDLNAAARRFLPGPSNAAQGKYLADVYPELFVRVEQSRADAFADVEMAIDEGPTTEYWQLRQSPLVDSGQAPSGWLVTLQDVTEQKHAETALRESEEKFRSISANALDAIIMIDSQGRISFWNRAAEKIFGYRAEEVIGWDLHAKLAPPDFYDKYRKAFTSFQHTGQGAVLGKTMEIDCLHKDGHTFTAELSLSPLKIDKQWHAVGILRDITERKKTQEYLIQNEKMVSLGGLAAGMAHEINNPLAGILGNIQLMHMHLFSDLPANFAVAQECDLDLEKLKAYLGKRGILEKIVTIEHACQRAAGIVRNMLDFSRKGETALTNHDLASLLDQTVELAKNDFQLTGQHDFRKIRIEHDYQKDMPMVPCDAGQIQQVVFNILKNGAQAMGEQGNGKTQPHFNLILKRQGRWACITIADNGPGMDEEISRRIFDPFYTTKSPGSGTGLGLSIAYFIITENHSGRLTVDSSPGRGTTFTIQLPLSPAGQSKENAA